MRGGDPDEPSFGKPPVDGKGGPGNIRIDHTSFGVQPWDSAA